MMRRERREGLRPPALPEVPQPVPWQVQLEKALPYLLLLAIGLPLAAYSIYLMRSPETNLVFSLPRGEWILWLRRFLLWGLLPLSTIALAVWAGLLRKKERTATFRFSRTEDVTALGTGVRAKLANLPAVLRILALVFFLFALMGPELKKTRKLDEEAMGIDIMITLDVSGSMSARDLYPNRLEAAKRVIDDFIVRRRTDRIGLVLFGAEAYWWCPLTLDHTALRTMLSGVRLGIVNPRATAIGDGIGTSLNRLRRSKTKSKVVILLTDGDNNSGMLLPRQAARFARTLNVRVYTILMGSSGGGRRSRGLLSFAEPFPVNPKLLEEIAATTGGTPYLAKDAEALKDRFQRILNSLEKTKLPGKVMVKRKPVHQHFLGLGIGLLLLELILSLTLLRRFP